MSDFGILTNKFRQNDNKEIFPDSPQYNDSVTRFIDVLIATPLIISLTPLMALLTFLISGGGRSSPWYRQERIGRNGQPFMCLKLRTMAVGADIVLPALIGADQSLAMQWAARYKLADDPRVTKLGKILRSSSLDEIPQLWNVLRGEMSLVGPRPIVRQEIPRYGRYFEEYCKVRPGITGLWQVSGRNSVTYRRRVALDVLYIRSRSLRRYLEILLRTIPAVLSRRGAC